MRLLEYDKDGEVIITSFDDNKLPPYAILSHRWGEDAEEVTFEDMVQNIGKVKSGYKKIRFCGEQAKRDGLQYFWIDTCCINKANKAEHSLAIQSMFRWYHDAARCYVYLSDVAASPLRTEEEASPPPWSSAFRQSKWFTRGWTLQELLAPSLVDFFSQEWLKLGDKISLIQEIHETTGIPHLALKGAPLCQFSVDERLRWKGDRETKRDEDAWYSLSGIFHVELAPAYSEGAASAFGRLIDQIHKLEGCIQDIRQTDPRDDKKRIQETKGGLLSDSYQWVLNNTTFQQWQQDQHSQLLWIKGDPGKGKTMLLCGVIDELQILLPQTALLSYFFCQATDLRINSATAVLRGLLYMLISQQPLLASHVRKKHDHAGKTLFEDPNAWVALTEIFVDVLQDSRLSTTYLIIDALDECITDRAKLLEFVARQSSRSDGVKWIVSSRYWPEIEAQLGQAGHRKLSLELNATSVAAAVNNFIHEKVDQLAQQKHYRAETHTKVLQHLTSNANDTFLWVALVCQDLKVTANRHVLRKLALFPPGLDALYTQMMFQISRSDDAEICRCVLASTAVLYRPVMISELVALVEQLEGVGDNDDVQEIVNLCGSFLTIREETVYFVHQSAKDFIIEKASRQIFPNSTKQVHQAIFSKSLEILSRTLHRDMYSLKAPGQSMENVIQPDLNLDPLATARYPCVYWIDHLCDSKPELSANNDYYLHVRGLVDNFLRRKYLYWLEGLSLCKSLGRGVVSIAKLWSLVQEVQDRDQGQDQFTHLVRDARRFVMYHKQAIESYPLQTYASALLFSPTGSLVKRLFEHEEPEGITIRLDMHNNWSACLQTLEGHSSEVNSVAFSHDSAQLASASGDDTIKIWDTSSGACLRTLEGHSSEVNSVAFSHDSAQLASVSYDKTVKIWDVNSGACLRTLEGHSNEVGSVAFSHNSAQLVSASRDNTIKIWNTSSGACLRTLEGHSNEVNSVAFSHDSAQLASASHDNTVKIWYTSSGACLRTLKGHSSGVTSVAFSHDSAQLASASYDWTFKIWDTSSSACLRTLEGHSSWVTSIAFSHDSAQLASASGDDTIKIWDTSSGACLRTLKGHSNRVNSVAFSHDSAQLASASYDKTIKIWDASSSAYPQTPDGHSHSSNVSSVAFSHDSVQLASASHDNTVKIWDTSSGVCLRTLEGHNNAVSSVAFSHDSAQLASASYDKTVKIWDVNSGACLHTFKGHKSGIVSVAFSHDSAQLASASYDMTVRIWDVSSGACLHMLQGHKSIISSVAFSHNSAQLASASYDKTVKIWDVSSGACLQTINTSEALHELSFNSTSSCLYTEIGPIAINSSQATGIDHPVEQKRPLRLRPSVSLDNTWIQYGGANILWVPSEYRPSCSSVCESTVGIGVGSGKVWSCRIDL